MVGKFLVLSALIVSTACTKKDKPANADAATLATQAPKELVMEDVKTGDGAEAVAGKTVVVHYTGMFLDGKKFDSSLDRNEPFSFQLGAGMVIKGWDQGVQGMKVGGKRKLTIPSHLAYGSAGAGGTIPPDTALMFDVELLEVK